MPDIDGWTVLAALRGNPKLSNIPVVMATITDPDRKGMTLGAAGYLTKPIDRDRLIALLRPFRRAPGVRACSWSKTMRCSANGFCSWLEAEHWLASQAENGLVALDRLGQGTARYHPARSHDAGNGRISIHYGIAGAAGVAKHSR